MPLEVMGITPTERLFERQTRMVVLICWITDPDVVCPLMIRSELMNAKILRSGQ